MSGRIRINVKFGDTKVLVPVGEGNITVEELISKAIDKFRKVKKLVSKPADHYHTTPSLVYYEPPRTAEASWASHTPS